MAEKALKSVRSSMDSDYVSHLSQREAAEIDESLMGPLGFSVDQLMLIARIGWFECGFRDCEGKKNCWKILESSLRLVQNMLYEMEGETTLDSNDCCSLAEEADEVEAVIDPKDIELMTARSGGTGCMNLLAIMFPNGRMQQGGDS